MTRPGDRARLRVVRDLPTVPSIPDDVRVPRRPQQDRWSQQRMHPAALREQPAWPERSPSRRPVAVPIGCALALALGGVLLLTADRDAGHPAIRGQHGTSATAAPPPGVALRLRSTTPQSSPTGPATAGTPAGPDALPIATDSAELADPLAGSVPDAYVQQLLDAASTSVPPVLPTPSRKAAVQAAGRVLVADLTGTGRDRFPGYWSQPTHSAWSHIRVQASTAQTAGVDPARVTVTLIWAGTSPTGEQVERRRTVITMELTEHGWWPVSVS